MLVGYARVTAYTRRVSKYSRIDTAQALHRIIVFGDELIKFCKNKEFITTAELTQILRVFKRSGAVASLKYLGLPMPLLDGKTHRKILYKAQEIIDWIKNINEIKDKNEIK